MARTTARDTEEFCAFVASRSAALFRVAYLVIGDHQLAQDLLQESLAKTYVAWPRLRDVSNAEAYTRRVIATTAISWRRRRGFHERPAEHLPESTQVDPAAPPSSTTPCGTVFGGCRRVSARRSSCATTST